MALTGCFSTRNYLRVRGEYNSRNRDSPVPVELPPRTRRIPALNIGVVFFPGTTSAYAENTCALVAPSPSNGNYLRVRGEYIW